jgi:hypothetical protein
MRVIVCGGRDYGQKQTERDDMFDVLDGYGITELAEGGAYGADRCASDWANIRGVWSARYSADWNKHGRAAGPIRNQQMLDEFKPDAVIAFPGGAGTADMIRRANAAGVEIIQPICTPEATP